MWERRPVFGALIGLTLLLSLWSLAIQDTQTITELTSTEELQQDSHQNVLRAPYTIHLDLPFQYNITHTPPVTIETLQENDFTKLINLTNFAFKINQKSCQESNRYPLVLILVHSAPSNIVKRNIIRETWGRSDPRSRLLFLLGANATLQPYIDFENETYGDIVQGNFIDAYRNMTYKHIMALKWFTYYCPDAKYLLKTDDDVFINSPNLYKFLESDIDRKKFLFCKKVKGARVKRTYRSKWRVSAIEYPRSYYPEYCPGFSIIYSPDVAFELYRTGQISSYFWIDDVFVTGILAKMNNIKITSVGDKFWKSSHLNNINDVPPDGYIFTIPDLKERVIHRLWQNVLNDERYDMQLLFI